MSARCKTRAEPGGDGAWKITGTKIYITRSASMTCADNIVHLVLARTPGCARRDQGHLAVPRPENRLTPTAAGGNDLRVVSIEHKLGIHASPTCVLSFGDGDDCTGG